jgi:hypothetical protein
VPFDGFRGDEQNVRDLGIRAAVACEFSDAPLGWG